jgi:hypothetical protein
MDIRALQLNYELYILGSENPQWAISIDPQLGTKFQLYTIITTIRQYAIYLTRKDGSAELSQAVADQISRFLIENVFYIGEQYANANRQIFEFLRTEYGTNLIRRNELGRQFGNELWSYLTSLGDVLYPAINHRAQINVEDLRSGAHPNTATEINSHVASIQLAETILGDLQQPQTITIRLIDDDGMDAEAITSTNTVVLMPRNLAVHADYHPITVHEFGHLVYNANIIQRVEHNSVFLQLLHDAEASAHSISSGAELGSDTFFTSLRRQGDLGRVQNWRGNLHRDGVMIGLEEFFADVVAVLPNMGFASISSSIRSQYPPEMIQEFAHLIDARDFSQQHSASAWSIDENHGYFGPARTFLREYIQQKYGSSGSTASTSDRASILQGVLEAITHEIVRYISNPALMSQVTPADANQHFIESLRSSLR